MGELWFVGLGLEDERGLSRRAVEVLRSAGEVFAEQYTAVAPEGTFDRLGREVGHPIRLLDRSAVEGGREVLAALARHDRVGFVVVGDPFAATTHVALRLAAEDAGHSWRYLPNASVLTAVAGFLGVMHYRFGRTVSLPFPAPGFRPTSPLDQISENRTRGLHTLVLLDLRPEEGRYLKAGEALEQIRALDPSGRAIPDSALIAVVARAGRDEARGFFGPFAGLRSVDFGEPMHAIVVLAPSLHFEEEAALNRYRPAGGRPGT